LVSFWVLGGGLLILQVFFDGIGWGFQLQQPAVLVALSALFVLVAINLFGVFEIGTSLTTLGGKGGGGGIGSNFLGGILAAVAASPCTAPFMGVALGALLLAPAWVAMLGFTALGLGMATPFVLLVISPAAQKLLPKPGMWMERFKQVLGFPLLITAVYLIWVYGRRVDQTGMAWLLVGLIIVSIGAWIYGAWGQLGRRWAQALALAAIAGGIALPLAMLPAEDASAPAFNVTGKHHGAIPWEPLEANTVASFQQQQQAYFIDFTADWCITCQANTARFNTEAVAAQLAELNIKPLIADWTKPSDFIAAALAKRGRRSIPVYVLWKPGWTSEQLLPQLLDENTVLEALQQP
jgi:thiol:disulfide interchange protein DsbD